MMMHINNQILSKKHIIITGSRGSGKSTLLRKIVSESDIDENIPGIITWCEPGRAVYMRFLGDDVIATIGIFDSESTSETNRMKPVKESFDTDGVSFLEKLINANDEWVFIDEIGYLESISEKYIENLKRLFDRKRVLAVVRKQNTDLIKEILNQNDAAVIDLDEI